MKKNINIKEMIQAKRDKRDALVKRSNETEDIAELRSITAEIDGVNADIKNLQLILETQEGSGQEETQEDSSGNGQEAAQGSEEASRSKEPATDIARRYTPGKGFAALASADLAGVAGRSKEQQELEERGKAWKERRSVLVATTGILVHQHEADTIEQPFNQVSSLIDRVRHMDLPGGDTFKQPFLIDVPAGDYKAEGNAYANADASFGVATIYKSKITAYSEISEELEKLPAAPYAQEVQDGILKSLRRKITQEILIGDGSNEHLTGIFSSAVTTPATGQTVPIIDPATDLPITGIDDTTLDEIVFNYGGAEDVEDAAVLILSKASLLAFSRVRTSGNNKQRFYEIKSQGNFGTINGVPYIINSACGSLSDAANTPTGENVYLMAYGSLSNYTLATFSEADIRRSDDFKFNTSMIAMRGSIFLGGNVTKQNGFLRVVAAGTKATVGAGA